MGLPHPEPDQVYLGIPKVFFITIINLFIWISGGNESIEDKDRSLIDARDLAEAIFLIYDKPEAKGRYICSSYTILVPELAEKLKSIYLNYNYPKRYAPFMTTDSFNDVSIQSFSLQIFL